MPRNAHTVVTAQDLQENEKQRAQVLADQDARERYRRQEINLHRGAVEAKRVPKADLAQQQQRVHAHHREVVISPERFAAAALRPNAMGSQTTQPERKSHQEHQTEARGPRQKPDFFLDQRSPADRRNSDRRQAVEIFEQPVAPGGPGL
jgi:hypothetical protein